MKVASVPRNCLVCDYGCSTTEGKENYREVSVCPKCNGAFVDLYHIQKYMKKDWKPNKEVQKKLMAKSKQDAFDAIMYGIDFATTKDKTSLLVIELENERSVPKVFYKGEEIKLKTSVQFDWDTDTEYMGGLTYAIEHYEHGKVPPVLNRIERRVKGHAT